MEFSYHLLLVPLSVRKLAPDQLPITSMSYWSEAKSSGELIMNNRTMSAYRNNYFGIISDIHLTKIINVDQEKERTNNSTPEITEQAGRIYH